MIGRIVAPGWQVRVVETTGSTNADLAATATPRQALVAENQTAGRGRHARVWQAPPGTCLTMSMSVDIADIPPATRGWIPLMAGVALTDAVLPLLDDSTATLKWPNDALLAGQKFAGILVEAVGPATAPVAVIGVGVNTGMAPDQLPVPTATSLNLHTTRPIDRAELAAALLAAVDQRFAQLAATPDALADDYRARCATLRRTVRIDLPDETSIHGTAEQIDPTGRIVVDGRAFSAGDVTHVRAK